MILLRRDGRYLIQRLVHRPKGTIGVISSGNSFIMWYVLFTTVPITALPELSMNQLSIRCVLQ